jgi:hypothetical protein
MASIKSRAPIRRRRACRIAAASSPNSSSRTSSLGKSGGSNRLGITAFTVGWRCTGRALGHPRERVGELPPGVGYMPKPWQPLNVLIADEQALASRV